MFSESARSVDYVRTADNRGLPLASPRVSPAAAVSTAPPIAKTIIIDRFGSRTTNVVDPAEYRT